MQGQTAPNLEQLLLPDQPGLLSVEGHADAGVEWLDP